ncbi:hypothetical protein [Deinococcus peraridilitoris]|uniref:Lipoprotein n=1 Tax=Deinococcus peraridilitoris (strain DSM 19664 / LMG 22246 / CIP 109416 / KR-200) TaxID=937777 RepID=L0A5I2_DEIPD|nr:hypothetical protein [Deinococcus peraridilitoris]AFZ69101.1 hypothetical protein Deipe_3675 [Deinococcus peraridilitoris DSM 19664]
MYKPLSSLCLAGLIAGCSSTTPDNRLEVRNVRAITEYQLANNNFVGCNSVEGASGPAATQTQVRVTVEARGALSALEVRLEGETNGVRDENFSIKVDSTNTDNFRAYGNNTYAVVFTADSSTSGGMLPASVPPVGIQAITPTPVVRNIKRVTVEPANQVNGNGRFTARVHGYSDQGSRTLTEAISTINIPVYSVCTLVGPNPDTGVNLLDYPAS